MAPSLNFRSVSIVTIDERLLQRNENFLERKKLSCTIADIGELTQTTLSGNLTN